MTGDMRNVAKQKLIDKKMIKSKIEFLKKITYIIKLDFVFNLIIPKIIPIFYYK